MVHPFLLVLQDMPGFTRDKKCLVHPHVFLYDVGDAALPEEVSHLMI